MVKALHEADIEVILDVVYNHTAEGNELGPTICFRGIDNAAYYRLVDDDKQHYYDTTGTGNSLLMRNPHVLQLIMDCLRYWVTEMHVDGFRFDLAATLARQFHEVDKLSAFFDIIQQDPVISQVKLIAEPWDVGDGGYQVGNFPPLWTEWNGKYRDTVRDFWRGEPAPLGEFASRSPARSDLYEHSGRKPIASINFITAHDGFTLRDLVSYNEKHNEANGEDGSDGEGHNRSWNCGVEGPTDDPEIDALRRRQQRNFLTTLLLSQGVPMLAPRRRARPHPGRQQQRLLPGQRDLSWVDWELDEEQRRPARVHQGRGAGCAGATRSSGGGASSPARADHGGQSDAGRHRLVAALRRADGRGRLATATPCTSTVWLNGGAIHEPDTRGQMIVDDDFLVFFNADDEQATFTVPTDRVGRALGHRDRHLRRPRRPGLARGRLAGRRSRAGPSSSCAARARPRPTRWDRPAPRARLIA